MMSTKRNGKKLGVSLPSHKGEDASITDSAPVAAITTVYTPLSSLEIERQNLDLHRYEVMMQYLASDNGIFWNRHNLLFVINITLLGIFGDQLIKTEGSMPIHRFLYLILQCVFGLVLCFVWHLTIAGSRYWLERWEKILVQIEASAFGEIEVYRNARVHMNKWVRTRIVARWPVFGFAIIWGAIIVFLILLRIYKWQ